jgi:K+-sensing histidine kinase KdpD
MDSPMTDDAMEPLAGRGRLRTYLGIAPGVGKTYAMLRDGRAQQLWLDDARPDPVTAFLAAHGVSEPVWAARQARACQLVIGSRRRSHWSRLLTGSTVADQVLRAAGDLPVQVVNVGRPDKTSHEWRA